MGGKGVYQSATIRLCSISAFPFSFDPSDAIMTCLSYEPQDIITAAQHAAGQMSPIL